MTSRPLQPRHESDVETQSNGEVMPDEHGDGRAGAPDSPGTYRGDEVAPEWSDRDGGRIRTDRKGDAEIDQSD